MNNTNQNHTDNFFKQGLNSSPEFKPSDKNWKEMERLLKPEAKRGAMGWIYTVSGIAAALLVFLSLWLVPEETETVSTAQPSVNDAGKGKADQSNSTINSSNTENVEPSDNKAQNSSGFLSEDLASIRSTRPRISANSIDKFDKGAQVYTVTPIRTGSILANLSNAEYAGIHPSFTDSFATQGTVEKSNPSVRFETRPEKDGKPGDRVPTAVPGRWALSLALSPDVNSVGGINKGDVGMSMGMGVSYRLGKALSVGTGIYYSKKLYSADKTSYKTAEKPFATWTSYSRQIDADCRVLDVPLNLTLRVSSKTENRIYATAGLSSYLMISEKYDFIYNGPSQAFPTGRREYTIRNENKHLLSVVNLGLALERPLSTQVSVVIQPYAKLPLTGIGQGETELKSFGLGMKLNYSIKKR